MDVTLIGMGPGNPDLLTVGAVAALEQADCFIGSQRLVSEARPNRKIPRLPATKAADIFALLEGGTWENPCVLYGGDLGFHSGAKTLIPLLEQEKIRVNLIPGLSSLNYLATKLGRSWQSWNVASAHGFDCDPVAHLLGAKETPVFFLTGGTVGAGALCRRLTEAGLGDLLVTIGGNLSYPDESIQNGTAAQFADKETLPLAVMLVEGIPPSAVQSSASGIEDNRFIRGEIPMTKQEVRGALLGKLAPKPGEIWYDIGAGTGSVSIELALTNPAGQVFAVEEKPAACALIQKNRGKFGAYNIKLVAGKAPETLTDLPTPDGAFIGGSGGQMVAILDALLQKNPNIRLGISAIAVETLSLAVSELTKRGLTYEISQISVARSRQAGELHLMIAQNPVWIITAQRGEPT